MKTPINIDKIQGVLSFWSLFKFIIVKKVFKTVIEKKLHKV